MQTLILPSEAFGSLSMPTDEKKVKESTKNHNLLNFNCFMIGSIGALIEETQHCEIIESDNICKVPLTPLWFKGIVNLRGNSIPIINLNDYYGIHDLPATRKKTHIMAIGKNQQTCGIEISNLPNKTTFHNDNIISGSVSLPVNMNNHSEKVYEKNGIWVHLNPDKLFQHIFSQLH